MNKIDNLFDTHCHFDSQDENEIKAVLFRAFEAGLTNIMAVGGSPELNKSAEIAMRIAKSYPDLPALRLAIGWDRDQASRRDSLAPLDFSNASAVGEIGLDYYYEDSPRKDQQELFASQLNIAREKNLPVVIHTRQADEDTLSILKSIPSRGIIHCFTGSKDFCRALLDLGFMISYSGIVTFRLADNVRETALYVPDDRILIETDSPYLAPVPNRGKKNEPAFILHTAKFLADLRKTPLEDFIALTTQNAIATLS
ncbi:MAG: TatD family hydrolase [Kiritimatiellae bacterium]|nr:TatD family hydrolase [Kiritimatiellia bacterium]